MHVLHPRLLPDPIHEPLHLAGDGFRHAPLDGLQRDLDGVWLCLADREPETTLGDIQINHFH